MRLIMIVALALFLVVGPVRETETWCADLNGDGRVEIHDFSILAGHFGQCGPAIAGDINGDGCVGWDDFELMKRVYNTKCECSVQRVQTISTLHTEPSAKLGGGLTQ